MSERRSILNTKFVDMPEAEHARWALVFLIAAVVVSAVVMLVGSPESAWAAAMAGLGAGCGIVFRLQRRLRHKT